MLIQAAGGVLPAGAQLRSLVRDGSAATTSKVELQQPPKMFCNFLLKGLALSEYTIGVLFTAAVLFIFFSSDGTLAIIGVNVEIAQFFSTIKPDSGRLLKI